MEETIFEKVDHYIDGLLNPEDDALKATIASITRENMPHISVSAGQGKLLQVFAKSCGAVKILELGTLAGYSTIWLARSVPENGKVISIEFDQRYADVAKRNIDAAGLGSKVEIRVGKALDVLPELEKENQGPFDMVFIDADKLPYTEYFQWALRLTRPGSIIIADNVVRSGKILDPDSSEDAVRGVQRLNQFLSTCPGITVTILQTVGLKTHDGMAVAVVN